MAISKSAALFPQAAERRNIAGFTCPKTYGFREIGRAEADVSAPGATVNRGWSMAAELEAMWDWLCPGVRGRSPATCPLNAPLFHILLIGSPDGCGLSPVLV
jgi:hypothetical protein